MRGLLNRPFQILVGKLVVKLQCCGVGGISGTARIVFREQFVIEKLACLHCLHQH